MVVVYWSKRTVIEYNEDETDFNINISKEGYKYTRYHDVSQDITIKKEYLWW
jgi:hypothetical protein